MATDNGPHMANLAAGWREWMQHEADLQVPGATQVAGALNSIESALGAVRKVMDAAGTPSAPGEGRVSALSGQARADSEMAGRVGVSSNYLHKTTVGGVAGTDPAKPSADGLGAFDRLARVIAGGPGVMTVVIGGMLFLLARGAVAG